MKLAPVVRHLLETPNHGKVLSKQNMPHHNYSSKQYVRLRLTNNCHQGLYLSTHSPGVDAVLKNKYVIYTNTVIHDYSIP